MIEIKPYIEFFVSPKLNWGPFEDPNEPLQITKITFGLQKAPNGGCFYECLSCGMCGCPSFARCDGVLPPEIYDHLKIHVEMRHTKRHTK